MIVINHILLLFELSLYCLSNSDVVYTEIQDRWLCKKMINVSFFGGNQTNVNPDITQEYGEWKELAEDRFLTECRKGDKRRDYFVRGGCKKRNDKELEVSRLLIIDGDRGKEEGSNAPDIDKVIEGLEKLGADMMLGMGQGDDQDDEKYESAWEEWGTNLYNKMELPLPEKILLPPSYLADFHVEAARDAEMIIPAGASIVPFKESTLLTPMEYDRDTRHFGMYIFY